MQCQGGVGAESCFICVRIDYYINIDVKRSVRIVEAPQKQLILLPLKIVKHVGVFKDVFLISIISNI